MFANPIEELEQLRMPNPDAVEDTQLTADAPTVGFDVQDQLFDIVVTLNRGTASKAVLQFGDNALTYDFANQKLDEMPLKMEDGKVTIRVLVDRPMFEVVGGGGACYKTSARRDMGQPIGRISLSAVEGDVKIESMKIYSMRSIWKK